MLCRLIPISKSKKKILEDYGWYINMRGGFTHPHGIDFLTRKEIMFMNCDHLLHCMKHGSCSRYSSKEVTNNDGNIFLKVLRGLKTY